MKLTIRNNARPQCYSVAGAAHSVAGGLAESGRVYTMRIQVIIAALIAGILTGQCATYYVATSGNDGDTGGDWTHALVTISNGVAKATVLNDIVLVSNGVYNLTTNILVTNAITLRSWNNGGLDRTNTILNGGGMTRCLYITNAGAMVAGFMVTNGNGAGNVTTNYGGGVYIGGAAALGGVLSNCIIRANTANIMGGGVYAYGNKSVIVDCQIDGNQIVASGQFEGGGGAAVTYGVISNTTLERNFATNAAQSYYSDGGGLLLGSNATAEGCLISSNAAYALGGGVILASVTGVKLLNCTIQDNAQLANLDERYNEGGGMAIYHPTDVLISGCTIARNQAKRGGGGVSVRCDGNGQGIVMTNCVISNNLAYSGFAGGINIYCESGGAKFTNRFYKTIFAGNSNSVGGAVWGGGLYAGYGNAGYGGSAVIEGCVFRNNLGAKYGGLYVAEASGGTSIVRNCLIERNSATASSPWGAAGLTILSNVFVQSCTIVSNVIGAAGSYNASGGLYFGSDGGSVSNTIVMFNTVGNWSVVGVTATPLFSYGCTSPNGGLTGVGNIDTDPLFVERNTGNYRLSHNSPCINRGFNQDWMTNAKDLDGVSRIDIWSGLVDMGTYEYLSQGSFFRFR